MSRMMESPAGKVEQLRSLYRQAGELEYELWNAAQSDPFAELSPAHARVYNDYLRQARELLPHATMLHREAMEAEEEMLVSDVHRYLRVAVVPELHKALPE
ncbi:MAG: hypothetical protein OHK0029_19790 [Armatimonadaceae bacterium]